MGWLARSGAAANAFSTFASTCASGMVLVAGACVWAGATAPKPSNAANAAAAIPWYSRNDVLWSLPQSMPLLQNTHRPGDFAPKPILLQTQNRPESYVLRR